MWLKEAMVRGGPESADLQDTLFNNVTWCNDLFGDDTTCVFLSLYKDPRKLNLSNALNYLIYVLLVFIMLTMGERRAALALIVYPVASAPFFNY